MFSLNIRKIDNNGETAIIRNMHEINSTHGNETIQYLLILTEYSIGMKESIKKNRLYRRKFRL